MFNFLDEAIARCSQQVRRLGGFIVRYKKGPPANEEQIARVARRFGGVIPPELLQLGLFANKLEFLWEIGRPGDGRIAGVYPFGQLAWEFSGLGPLDPRDYCWAEDIIAGKRDGVWHQKAIIDCATDGDFLAYTIDPALSQVPVYCAHDGCGPSELILGQSLVDFYRDWARIGFLHIGEFYEWPRRSKRDSFSISYYSEFEGILNTETTP